MPGNPPKAQGDTGGSDRTEPNRRNLAETRIPRQPAEGNSEPSRDRISSELLQLSMDLTDALTGISEKLERQVILLDRMRIAFARKKREIEELHKIDLAATTLEALSLESELERQKFEAEQAERRALWEEEKRKLDREHAEFRQDLEQKSRAEQEKFESERASRLARWEADQRKLEMDLAAYQKALREERAQEAAEYERRAVAERARIQAEFETRMQALESANAAKQAGLERGWEAREADLKRREEEWAKLHKVAEVFSHMLADLKLKSQLAQPDAIGAAAPATGAAPHFEPGAVTPVHKVGPPLGRQVAGEEFMTPAFEKAAIPESPHAPGKGARVPPKSQSEEAMQTPRHWEQKTASAAPALPATPAAARAFAGVKDAMRSSAAPIVAVPGAAKGASEQPSPPISWKVSESRDRSEAAPLPEKFSNHARSLEAIRKIVEEAKKRLRAGRPEGGRNR